MAPMLAVPCAQGFQPVYFVPVAVPMPMPVPKRAEEHCVVPRKVQQVADKEGCAASKQVQRLFRKTRLCESFRRGLCSLGASCRFAHSSKELAATPDLRKTKLCFGFFRGQCSDVRCDFAHGYEELRKTEGVYKTELCHGWVQGKCRFGATCRFAHGSDDLQGARAVAATVLGDVAGADAASDHARERGFSGSSDTASVPLTMRWSDMDSDDEDAPAPTKAESDRVSTRSTDSTFDADSDELEVLSTMSDGQPEVDQRTSLRICGLREDFTRAQIVQLLQREGFGEQFDFVYMPSDFATGRCFGYAFVNFCSAAAAANAQEVFDSHEEFTVGWADTQGLSAYVQRFRNSPVMHPKIPDEAKPAMFRQGSRAVFPAPTRHIQAPRLKRA